MDDDQATAWLPLDKAAQRLGTTVDALRKKARRGIVESRKGNDGRILVLASGEPAAGQELADPDELLDLREDVERWRTLAEERGLALAKAEARLESREMVLTELRLLLADARKPWWRKLTGD